MHFERFDLAGPVLIRPQRHGDDRGYFAETYRADAFAGNVDAVDFVQENESLSARAGTVRGLHFQAAPFAQGKLMRCIAGSLFDVVVDIRTGSPGFGRWLGVELSAAGGAQLWVPPGFAHGFCTLVPDTVIAYKVSAYYSRAHDLGLAWDDPALGIDWPACADPATLSPKDRVQPLLTELPDHFTYSGG